MISIAAGGQHTCALREDGSVWCWGSNTDGQAGDGTKLPRLVPGQLEGLAGVRQVSAGARHNCVLTLDAEVFCWGANDQGQLGAGTTVGSAVPVFAKNQVRAVYAGSTANHTCAIDGQGYGYCWGSNSQGQLGIGTTGGFESLPQLVVASCPDFTTWTNIDCHMARMMVGGQATCSSSATGPWVHCWGDEAVSSYVVSEMPSNTPYLIGDGLTDWSIGSNHTCWTGGGDGYCLGADGSGQAGAAFPWSDLANLTSGAEFNCGRRANGKLYCWGNNSHGQLGASAYCSGGSCSNQASATTPVEGVPLVASNSTPDVALDYYHACAKGADGGLTCWGYNASGQLGTGGTTSTNTPVSVVGLGTGVASVVTGTYHTCALKSDGSVWCWGRNNYGQIGTGSIGGQHTVPQQVLNPRSSQLVTGVIQLAAGKYHTCARTVSDQVFCWGLNDGGQAGSSDFTPKATPVMLSDSFRSIGVGPFHSCGVDDQARLRCWGRGANLGLGTPDTHTPQVVAGLPGSVSEVKASSENTCALVGNGSLYCWGRNLEQQIDATQTPVSAPRLMSGVSQVTHFAVGSGSICAQTLGETRPKCWGSNNELQLGRDSTNRTLKSPTPVLVSAETNTRTISGTLTSFCTLGTFGEVRCWGTGENGQLSSGANVDAAVGATAIGSLCSGDELAPDANPCTLDRCVMTLSGSSGSTVNSWDNAACNDGTACNGVDRCNAGACVADLGAYTTGQGCGGANCASPPPPNSGTDTLTWFTRTSGFSCDDENPCTTSACDGGGSCVGTALPVDDGNPCTVDSCSPSEGVIHTAVNDGVSCADANACNGAEVCAAGVCSAGIAPTVDDNNPCTIDACDPISGVSHAPVQQGFSCNDDNPCTTSACDGAGSCVGTALPVDDGNPCTVDSCSPSGGVVHTPGNDGASCADANACNGAEVCAAGVCTAGAVPSVDDNNPCTIDACDPITGFSHTPVQDDTPCSNGNACDGEETCQTGTCTTGTAPTAVDSGNPCTRVPETCHPQLGWREVPEARGFTCATDASCDGAGRCIEGELGYVPPDPKLLAPPLKPSADFHAGIAFLYESPTPVQYGVQPETIVPERAAVVLGSVLGRDASGAIGPLPEVIVTIKDHPEFGGTITRADGRYDLAVNGGGEVIVEYARSGYFAAQRIVSAEWGTWSPVDDVVLIAPDPVKTLVTFGAGSSGFQVATSSVRDDGDNPRSATLMFQGGTEATIITNGQPSTPGTLTIRATEYTVSDPATGASGRDMMPGPLPAYSGYTYAVELSADEALDADTIQLSKPAFLYVDNFLDFNVGEPVPAGHFDRQAAVWKASDNGIILRLIGSQNGRANVTIDNTGSTLATPAELTVLGITDAELVTLNTQYPSSVQNPVELWRVPITHFTPWDCNWAVRPPECDEGGPCDDDRDGSVSPQHEPRSCGKKGGSIISCESRTLGESIPIAGTRYTLNYRSDRTRGYHGANALRVQLPPKRPTKLQNFLVKGSYGGRTFRHEIAKAADHVDLLFDPVDVYGRPMRAPAFAKINLSQEFEPVYLATNGFGSAGGMSVVQPNWTLNNPNSARLLLSSSQDYPSQAVGRITGRSSADEDSLGGWSLNVYHRFDPSTGMLHFGNGQTTLVPNAATPSENPTAWVSGGGSPPPAMLARPDGSLYFIDYPSRKVRRATLVGTVWSFSDITGGGYGSSGDGGPAAAAKLSEPSSLAGGSDGSVYIADLVTLRIRVIDPNGIIHTIAGTGISGRAGEGGPANLAQISAPQRLAVAPDGSVYFVDVNPALSPWQAVRVIRPDGVLSTLFGSDQTVDGWMLGGDFRLAVDPNGKLVFGVSVANGARRAVFRYEAADRLTLLAGAGPLENGEGQGVSASAATLANLNDIDFDRDGNLVVTTAGAFGGVWRVVDGKFRGVLACASEPCADGLTQGTSVLAVHANPTMMEVLADESIAIATDGGFGLAHLPRVVLSPKEGEYLLPSEDASTYFEFNLQGEHLGTYSAGSGAPIREFSYGENRRLETVVEYLGNGVIETTQITYVNGVASGVKAPRNRVTSLTYDQTPSGGDLKQLELRSATGPGPDAPTWTMDYHTQARHVDARPGYIHAQGAEVIRVAPQTSAGLLKRFADPDGKTSEFEYTPDGHLEADMNVGHGDVQRLTECPLSVDGDGDCACEPATDEPLVCKQPGRFVSHVGGGLATTKYWVQADVTGSGEQRITEAADGTQSSVVARDDIRVASFPFNCDGSTGCKRITTTSRFAPDPIWVVGGTYESSRVTTLPSGASLSVTSSRAATPDSSLPHLTAAWTRTTSIAGDTYIEVYDRAGAVIVSSSPEGRARTVHLDNDERVSKVEIPGLIDTEFEYDTSGRLSKVKQGTTRERTFTYHSAGVQDGYLASVAAKLGGSSLTSAFTRDAYGRATVATSAAGDSTTFDWSPAGRLEGVTPPGKTVHRFSHNGFGATAAYTAPDLIPGQPTKTEYEFNAGRQFLSEQQPDGSLVRQTYDSKHRPESLEYPGGSVGITYFETKANCTGAGCFGGAVKSITSSDNLTLSFEYDGPLLKKSSLSGDTSATLSWTHDARWRPTSESLSYNGTSYPVDWALDRDGQATCVTFGDCEGSGSGRLLYSYEPGNGLLAGTTLDSLTEDYAHNTFGELAAYEAKYLTTSKYKVTYDEPSHPRDALGRVTRKTEVTASGTRTEDYQYDANGRLTQVVRGSETTVYAYDANGNRASRSVNGVVVESAPPADAQDRLSSYGEYAYGYDPRGNLESKSHQGSQDTTRYEYNALGALKSVSFQNGDLIEYLVDGFGRRTQKKLNGVVVRRYIWNSNLTLAAEVDASGEVVRYAYGAKRVPELITFDGDTYKVITDQLGSIRLLIDVSNGSVAFEQRYDEYGRIVSQSGNPNITSLGFAGGLYDTDTELTRFGARDYDAYTGRWTAKDPIGLAGGLNVYEYARSQPVNLVDASGRFPTGLGGSPGVGAPGTGGEGGAPGFLHGPGPRIPVPGTRPDLPFGPTLEQHADRNQYNRCPAKEPNSSSLGSIMCSSAMEDEFTYDPKNGSKYRGTMGNECAYDSNGNLLGDGTFNFADTYLYEPWGIPTWGHFYYDWFAHHYYGGYQSYTPNMGTVAY